MNLILASASPRRSEILKNSGYKFQIIPSEYSENILNHKYSDEIVENCAYQKALSVSEKYPEHLVIGADTVVVHNNIILGKPKNFDDAKNMLHMLSNNTHFVATAVCLIKGNKVLKGIEHTNVTFRKLTDTDIEKYLNNSKPFDKAGSYGIQDDGFDFAVKVEGEIDNVIGFPVKLFKKLYLFL